MEGERPMVRRNSGILIRQINSLLTAGTFSGLSDGQLLERFLAGHDEVSELAFTVLVERHGPMVLGVCRRILADPHDAEDAFQATFLVLVRRAASVQVNGSIGRWLFGVATRVASRSRADLRRRHGREHNGLDRLEIVAEEGSPTSLDRAEVQSILAQEIARLPDRLQAPVILCDLEGSSDLEAARRLGWPVGTVKSRLSRARARLRVRLTRRGLAPSDLAITTPMLPASLPQTLVEATTRAAQSLIAGRLTTTAVVSASVSTLTRGVLRTMYWTKLKLAIAATLVIVGGSAVVFSQAAGQRPGGPGRTGPPTVKANSAPSGDEIDLRMIETAWADAVTRSDSSIVSRIIADDFEGIDPSGNLLTKATYVPDIEKGVFQNQRVEVSDIKTRTFGETAVVTGRFWLTNAPKWGRMTHVFVKRQGRWQCVASHASWSASVGCPAVGTAADRDALAVRETRDAARRTQATAVNCAICHQRYEHQKIEPPQSRDPVPPVSARPGDTKAGSAGGIRVEIDSRGVITIQGKPVAAEEKALVEQLGIARRETGRDELNFFEAAGAPSQLVSLILGAAGRVGVERFTLERLSGTTIPAGFGRSAAEEWNRALAEWRRLGATTQVRPPFDGRVEKVLVKVGQTVKKGDPLLELESTSIESAKTEYKIALRETERAQAGLRRTRERQAQGFGTESQVLAAQNAEDECRLRVHVAEDKLRVYGMTEEQIKIIPKEDDNHRARFTVRSRVDGRVTRIAAEPGNYYDKDTELMVIEPISPSKPAGR